MQERDETDGSGGIGEGEERVLEVVMGYCGVMLGRAISRLTSTTCGFVLEKEERNRSGQHLHLLSNI